MDEPSQLRWFPQATPSDCRREGTAGDRRGTGLNQGWTAVTTIRANCPSCGDVQLKASELTVRVCSDDERGSYCFRCPECRRAVAKDASRRIVDLLVSS